MDIKADERTTVQVGANPAGHSDFFLTFREPSWPLVGTVSRLAGYRETIPGHMRQCEVASLVVPLVISFGAPFEIGLGHVPGGNDRIESFAAGLFDGHVVIDSFGACRLQIDFTPLGARRFFGIPMQELAGCMVALEDLPGSDLRLIRERLGAETNWQRRFDLAERFVLSRITGRPLTSPEIAWAYHRLADSNGSLRIGTLVDEIGGSRKHLARRFRTELGLTPKQIARILRFNRALHLARQTVAPDWADIAADCGYADQPHLTREFRAFAGVSPTSWRVGLT